VKVKVWLQFAPTQLAFASASTTGIKVSNPAESSRVVNIEKRRVCFIEIQAFL
jgi:hypothetical protein